MVKLVILLLVFCILAICYGLAIRGWNVATLHNPQLIQQLNTNCPENEKDKYGNCPPKYTQSYTYYYPFIIGNSFRSAGRQNEGGSITKGK